MGRAVGLNGAGCCLVELYTCSPQMPRPRPGSPPPPHAPEPKRTVLVECMKCGFELVSVGGDELIDRSINTPIL